MATETTWPCPSLWATNVKRPESETRRADQVSRPSNSAITPVQQKARVQNDARTYRLLKDEDELIDEESWPGTRSKRDGGVVSGKMQR